MAIAGQWSLPDPREFPGLPRRARSVHLFPPIAVPLRRQVWGPGGANNLCVSTSPPPGEPGPGVRLRRRWRVPAVPVLAALIVVVLMSGLIVAVDHVGSAGAVAAAAAAPPTPGPAPAFDDLPVPPTTVTTLPPAAAAPPAPRTTPIPPPANPTPPAPIRKTG